MAVTYTLVEDVNASGDPANPTLASAPTDGDLMICVTMERSGTSHTAFTLAESGWTKAWGHDNEIADSSARFSIALFFKKAASEGTSPTGDVDNGTANTKVAALIVMTPSTVPDSYSIPTGGTTTAGTGTGSSSPLDLGTTSSLSAADYLVFGAMGWRQQGATLASMAIDFTEDFSGSERIPETNGMGVYFEGYDDASGGTYSGSASWTGSGHEGAGGIAVIEAVTGGGGGASVVPSIMVSHRRRRVV